MLVENTVIYRKILILVIVLSFWTGIVKAEVISDWGDVVDINYSLWEDAAHTIPISGNIDVDLTYIYLSTSSTVPASIQALFPQASASYLLKFKEEIVGLVVGEQKNFMIAAADAYGDRDLYYLVEMLRIHYDASGGDTSETVTTTTQTRTSPVSDLFAPTIIIGGAVLAGVVFVIFTVRSSRQTQKVLSKEMSSSVIRETGIREQKSQLKDLRELTESFGEKPKTPEKGEVKFRRRR